MKHQNSSKESFLSSSLSPSSYLPSLSSLGGGVLTDFNKLHLSSKGVFNRLYRAVYNWLYPKSKLDSFHLIYSITDILKENFSFPYPLSTFFYFCRLYSFTNGGANTIDSRLFKPGPVHRQYIADLIRLGYISRSSFLPSSPYLIKNRCQQKVFISLTTRGISFYNKVLNEVYKRAKSDLYQLTQDF